MHGEIQRITRCCRSFYTRCQFFLAFVPHAFSFCIGGVSFLAFFFDLAMQFLLTKRAPFYSGGEKRRNLLEPEHLSIPSLR